MAGTRGPGPAVGHVLAGAVVLVVMAVFSLGLGSAPIRVGQALNVVLRPAEAAFTGDMVYAIVWDLRLPRVLLVVLVGAALATAGTGFQALFQNPLADPFVIGAASGAALGAAVAIVSGANAERHSGFGTVALAAFVGALGAVLAVYLIGELRGQIPTISFLLAGVAVSTMLSAAVSLLMVFNDRSLAQAYYWLMGGFSGRSWNHLRAGAPYMGAGMALMFGLHRLLDVLLLGEDGARSLGTDLRVARALVITAGTVITGAAVAVSGIIGFVGLIAPHIGRMLVGARHSILLPVSALLGAALLLLADNLGRTVLAPLEVPVGIITSAIGGPFFLALLLWYPTGFRPR